MGQFSNSFPKRFSYLCEYAIRFDLSCSNCEYPAIFQCLHCSPSCSDPDSLLLAYLWLRLFWTDCISANKSFSSSRTSSRKPYTSSKQQERHKHSVEITINVSHSEQRRPARAHAVGPVLGPHARTDRTRDTRVAEPWLPAPEDGRPGEGQSLTPDAPHNGGRPPPPGTAPHHPRGTQPPQGMQAKGTVLGSHTHTPAPTARGWRTQNSPPSGRAVGGGTAPDLRRPSQWWKAPPPGDALPPSRQRATPARKGARCGARAGSPRPHRPHPGHMVAEPWLPAPKDGRPGEGQRLTPDAPHNGGRPPPPGTAPHHHPRGRQPSQGMQAKGTVLGPHNHTPAPTARGRRTPTARPVGGQSAEGQRLTSDVPHNGGWHPPRGRPSATPTASNAGPQGRTLWGRCWVPTPATTAPGTHGSRNPGCPLQRTGGRRRDSA